MEEKYVKMKQMFLNLKMVSEPNLYSLVTSCKIEQIDNFYKFSTLRKTYLYQLYYDGKVRSGTYNNVYLSNKSITITHKEGFDTESSIIELLNRITEKTIPSKLYAGDELAKIISSASDSTAVISEKVSETFSDSASDEASAESDEASAESDEVFEKLSDLAPYIPDVSGIYSFVYNSIDMVLRVSSNAEDKLLNLCENTFNIILYQKCQELVKTEKLPYNPIIRPLNLFSNNGTFVLIMEKKQTLKEYIYSDCVGRFEKVVVELAKVLNVLQQEIYFIHGDLKYDNVLLDGDNICLIDFGFTAFIIDKYYHHTENFDLHVNRNIKLSHTDLAFFLLTCFAFPSSVHPELKPIIDTYIRCFFRNPSEVFLMENELKTQYWYRYCNTLFCNHIRLKKNIKNDLNIEFVEKVIRTSRIMPPPPPPPPPPYILNRAEELV